MILVLAGGAAALGGVLLLPVTAAAGGRVVPGAECSVVGATGWHGDDQYRCVRKPGDDCPHWHWAYRKGTPHTWSPRPAGPCDCPSPSASAAASSSPPSSATPSPSLAGSPSPSATASATPSATVTTAATPTPTGTDTTTVGDQLPVTGGPVVPLLAVGGLVLLAGLGARRYGRRTT